MLKKRKKDPRLSDPATKGDVMDMGSTLRREFKSDIDTMGHSLRKEFKSDMSAMEYRFFEQMGLLLEHHRHEIIGATKDDVDSLKTRVRRLEQHAGFAAVV